MSSLIQGSGTATVVYLWEYKWRKKCLTPNKFQLPQLLWEVRGLMEPSSSTRKCWQAQSCTSLMKIMLATVSSLVWWLSFQEYIVLGYAFPFRALALFLPFFWDTSCALEEVLIAFTSSGSQLSTITYFQHFIQLWISALATVCRSKQHWIYSHLCLGQLVTIKLSNDTHKKCIYTCILS